jgi:hypothetical protein
MNCTHTSAWHKEMRPCMICGAEYSEEEQARISTEAMRPLGFSAEQLATIERLEAEALEEQP